jgi:YHS domain-containing protein
MNHQYRSPAYLFFGLIPVVCSVALLLTIAAAEDKDSKSTTTKPEPDAKQADNSARDKEKKALTDLQFLVGEWKGVGQPKRGSSSGSWNETSSWAWHFDKNATALRGTLKDGKYFSAMELTTGEKPGEFALLGTLLDGKTTEKFVGARDAAGILVLKRAKEKSVDAKKPVEIPADRPVRITIKVVADNDRLVVLYERAQGDSFARLAEVGATRVGGMFAAGAGGPECIVTGGAGTIAVEYKGKTYYVCCSGCKEAFNDDPEGIIAEYNARRAKAKK